MSKVIVAILVFGLTVAGWPVGLWAATNAEGQQSESISGTALRANGTLLTDVQVQLFRALDGQVVGAALATSRTNSRGEWMPDKEHSTEKIDPMCAMLMAFSLCINSDGDVSVYEEAGNMSW